MRQLQTSALLSVCLGEAPSSSLPGKKCVILLKLRRVLTHELPVQARPGGDKQGQRPGMHTAAGRKAGDPKVHAAQGSRGDNAPRKRSMVRYLSVVAAFLLLNSTLNMMNRWLLGLHGFKCGPARSAILHWLQFSVYSINLRLSACVFHVHAYVDSG